jgi:four helix bundle protein
MRRALASVPLNVAEGAHSRGKLRTLRYATAAGSLRETFAGVDTAIAFGYIAPIDSDIAEMQRAVIGTLVKCMR